MAKHTGRGIAAIEYPTGMNQNGDPSQCWIKVKPDGRIDVFAGTADIPYDTSGRIIMPPRLKRRADIDDLAMFIGMGPEFQIWNPWLAFKSKSKALSALAADLLEERKAAA